MRSLKKSGGALRPRPRRLSIESLESRSLMSVTITGTHHEQIAIKNPTGTTNLDGAFFPALEDVRKPANYSSYAKHQPGEASNAELYPISLTGVSQNIKVFGGTVQGQFDANAPWHAWKGLADGTGLRFEGSGTTEVSDMRLDNLEDGIDPRGPFYIHDVYMTRIHDDMVENDAVKSGRIENSFMSGFSFLSARGTSNPSAVVQVRNSVIELKLVPYAGGTSPSDTNTRGGYPYADGLGVGGIFKFEWGSTSSGKVDISDTVFLVPRFGGSSNKSMQFPPGKYKNVTVVWLGAGDYPHAAPPGVTITKDRGAFDRAVDKFFANHRQFTRDGLANSPVPGGSIPPTVPPANAGSPVLSISDATARESAGTMTFTVTLSQASSSAVSVEYEAFDVTTIRGKDFVKVHSTLKFAPGETKKVITIALRQDDKVEGDETFSVKLTKPKGAAILDGEGLGTIVDDDR